ncbi:hypothetical protein MANES_01G066633v8 [Manihot esculenta]|uniref:Uncharacterized protein n=1 Tax=Manihot esculenta TaxID=3983 RepID=A0ACB7IGA6_MANES|nr:hypothetical protein MANES_01G066633v8 [Manihot esculenta]
MIFTDFLVLNEKEVSFEKKRPRRFLPGSAAESEVRPPNMSWFRKCFWPPKAMFEQTRFGRRTWGCFACMLGRRRRFGWPPIKAPQTENGRDFSPFSSSGVFMSSFGHFHVFSSSPSYF